MTAFTSVKAFLSFQTAIFGIAGYKHEDASTFLFGPSTIVQWIFIIGSVTELLLVVAPWIQD